MSTTPDDLITRATERVRSRRLAEEQAEIDAEIAAAQHAAQLSRAQREQAQRAQMLRVIEQLKALAPRYAERSAAALAALEALSRFVTIERGLLADERRAFAGLNVAGMDGGLVLQLTQEIRQAAGLPLQHDRLDLTAGPDEARRVSLTALIAIVVGLVDAGAIMAGGSVATLNIT